MREQKTELRATMRQIRRQIADRHDKAVQIAERIWDVVNRDSSQTIAPYLATRDEVDTDRIVAEAWSHGMRVAVPYCDGPNLRLVTIADWSDLIIGTFGVREPAPPLRATQEVPVQGVNVILVPGLAFDRQGRRLGYGRGYYDKLLSQKNVNSMAIGIAFAAQMVDQVPCEPHDAHVDWIVTEDGVLRSQPGP